MPKSTDISGKVIYVTDGDTFTVELENGEEEKVRPILVNAPEICHNSSPSDCKPEPFGEEATAFAKDTLQGETVFLERDESERDQYGRMLFYVYLENGEMYQEKLLEEGLAEVAVYEPDTKYQQELEKVEEKAKSNNKGQWQ